MNPPSFFSSIQDAKQEEKRIRANSNSRYKTFNQTFYTAGDISQFKEKIALPVSLLGGPHCPDPKDEDPIVDTIIHKNIWSKNKGISSIAVVDTFQYIYHKFKKALYIRIRDNKLDVFLPFSNPYFYNDWGHTIQPPPNFSSNVDFLIHCDRMIGYKTYPNQYHSHANFWYANNSLVRTENPTKENDKGLAALWDLFTTLCATRSLPDIELFINKRDYPIIKRNETESYDDIFGSDCKLQSYLYDKYCPILSSVTTDVHADIPMPTIEDWVRASNQEDRKYYAYFSRDYLFDFSTEWEQRKPVAVFRGSSTGTGVTVETNPRLKLACISKQYPEFLDAGITKWCLRPRKVKGVPYLQTIDPKLQSALGLVSPLTPLEQSKYKYIINVDGHVSAFRLSLELSMGSVVLLVDSPYKMWYRSALREWEHFVPVQADLSDLMTQILWCMEHDAECKIITQNALEFYKKYLCKDGILNYLQTLLVGIKQEVGDYVECPIPTLSSEGGTLIQSNPNHTQRRQLASGLKQVFFPPNRNIYALEGLYQYLQENEFGYGKEMILHQGKHGTLIRLMNIFAKSPDVSLLLKKSASEEDNPNELVHKEMAQEIMIGMQYVNTRIMKRNKHFRYTLYSYPNGNILFEYIQGITYLEYLRTFGDRERTCTGGTTEGELQTLLSMILLALATAQEECCFVHNDLYPWNIIIQRGPMKTYHYSVGGKKFSLRSEVEPIIIDYGKSQVSTLSFSRDPFCLIITTIYELLSIPSVDTSILLYLIQFFEPLITTKESLTLFVEWNKKFTAMSDTTLPFKIQYEVRRLHPLKLFEYLHRGQEIETNSVWRITELYHPPECYIHLIQNNIKGMIEWMDQFIETIHQKILPVLQGNSSFLIVWYVKEMSIFRIKGVLQFCQMYLPKTKSEGIVKQLEELVKQLYTFQLDQFVRSSEQSLGVPKMDRVFFGYSEKMLSQPSKILMLIQRHSTIRDEHNHYFVEYHRFITSVFRIGVPIPTEFLPVLEWDVSTIQYSKRMYDKMIHDCRQVYPLYIKLLKDPHMIQVVEQIVLWANNCNSLQENSSSGECRSTCPTDK